jgi:hypothetical protein
MTRGDMTTSQGGHKATRTENMRAMTRSGGTKRGGDAVERKELAQHQWMIGGGQQSMKKNNATIKQDSQRWGKKRRAPSVSTDVAGMAPASLSVCTQSQGGGADEGLIETVPPGARPIMMGVWEADVAQACGWRNKSSRGKEGGSGRGHGCGNDCGNVIVQAADGG